MSVAPRTARRLAPAVALLASLGLGACGGGQRDATHDGVRSRVSNFLVERADDEGGPVDRSDADEIGSCVADEMFSGDTWSKDERNAATRAVDGSDPDPDLVAKLEALLEDCGAAPAAASGPAAGDDTTTTTERSSSGDDTTTTTERSSAGSDGTTTTTEG